MAKASYVHVERGATFSFHLASGELVEIKHDAPFSTDDQGLIAYLDTTPFVKRATTKAQGSSGEEA
jgi:hypothetical protein